MVAVVKPSPVSTVAVAELVSLCATDLNLYNRHFFPKAFRQKTPKFHEDMFQILLSDGRYIGFAVHRDGAKTTILRAFTSHRIAYGISRTILFVSEAQDHAIKSVRWIKSRVEEQGEWAQTFGLQRGSKWTDEWLEIYHSVNNINISIVALGITGQTRGLNIDDFRPDLIIVDDPCDEENTATAEQRLKINNLFFGALQKSLAPASENVGAKMVLLQTPLHGEDLIAGCLRDPQWITRVYSCFDDDGESRWPSRYPTKELRRDKAAHIARNQLSLWKREMECEIVSPETSLFRKEWLVYWHVVPERMVTVLAIDPVPPPSDLQLSKGLVSKDYEVLSVVGGSKGNYYLLDYRMSRGHNPEWTVANFFSLLDKWHPLKVRISGIAYERVLKWLLEKAMSQKRQWIQINAVADKRKKIHRITQSFSGIASGRRFHIHQQMADFEEQFTSFPNTRHDDILDSVSMALDELMEHPDLLDSTYSFDEQLEPLPRSYLQRAP